MDNEGKILDLILSKNCALFIEKNEFNHLTLDVFDSRWMYVTSIDLKNTLNNKSIYDFIVGDKKTAKSANLFLKTSKQLEDLIFSGKVSTISFVKAKSADCLLEVAITEINKNVVQTIYKNETTKSKTILDCLNEFLQNGKNLEK